MLKEGGRESAPRAAKEETVIFLSRLDSKGMRIASVTRSGWRERELYRGILSSFIQFALTAMLQLSTPPKLAAECSRRKFLRGGM